MELAIILVRPPLEYVAAVSPHSVQKDTTTLEYVVSSSFSFFNYIVYLVIGTLFTSSQLLVYPCCIFYKSFIEKIKRKEEKKKNKTKQQGKQTKQTNKHKTNKQTNKKTSKPKKLGTL